MAMLVVVLIRPDWVLVQTEVGGEERQQERQTGEIAVVEEVKEVTPPQLSPRIVL